MNMVIGKIEAIDGNKITLAVADTESMFGGERPTGDFSNFNGEMPEGFNPQMGGGMINFDLSSLTYSGEIKEYTVPEGMKIGDGDYTSLKVGDIIMITFDQEGGIGEIRAMPKQAVTDEQVTE